MVQFEIQIIERDDESGISELARYSEVNSMIGKEINAILLELWNAGEVAAWFETIEDEDEEDENPHLEEDQGGRFSDRAGD